MKRRLKTFFEALGFLSYPGILIFLFTLLPIVFAFAMAFTDMGIDLKWNFVGVENFLRFRADPTFLKVVLNTLIFTFGTVSLCEPIALVLAFCTTMFMNRHVGNLARSIMTLPRVVPRVIYMLLVSWALAPVSSGLLNHYLGALFGASPRNWIWDYAMPVVILTNLPIPIAWSTLIYSSAIKAIPSDYIIAAKVDGASTPQIFRYIILPLLKFPIVFLICWNTLSHIRSYSSIFFLTEGGPFYDTEVLALYSFDLAFGEWNLGYGAATVILLAAFSMSLYAVYRKIFGIRRLMEPSRVT